MPAPPLPPNPRPSKFAAPIIKIYEDLTDELLVNIAGHFDARDDIGVPNWQIKKLAELGKLTEESAEIIARHTTRAPEEVHKALLNAATVALDALEPELREAVARGVLIDPQSAKLSPRIITLLEDFQAQAIDTLNLVNTVMLDSCQTAYKLGLTNISYSAQQLQFAQATLNTGAGAVVLGTKTMADAVGAAVLEMSRNGITGFIDKVGHRWSAEAYVTMDLRTTMHNTYLQSTFARNQDYGNDLVYAGAKATSRPGCYPWQGKILSMSNRSGYVEDLNGSGFQIYPISETTYGQPSGIWGINCGHSCNVFVPSLSIMRDDVPPRGENDKRYEQSQEQRAIERDIREAKREALMMDAANDKDGFERATKRVKEKKAQLGALIAEAGNDFGGIRTSVLGY